ncbi:MAG: J domain-containing protein [Myxococcota bacterium]
MSLFDRFGTVVRAEWRARFSDDIEAATEAAEADAVEPKAWESEPRPAAPVTRLPTLDVGAALRTLELPAEATLDEVRASYRRLARRYHPHTLSASADQAHAAETVLRSLTAALELLEAHLLPLPRGQAASVRRG